MITDEQMMELDEAIELALTAHQGQRDKAGEPYILHPLRVMLAVKPDERVAAVLHDVLEDSEMTADDLLANGISAANVDALQLLTRHNDTTGYEPYAAYINRVSQSALARAVKMADLRDNIGRANGLNDAAERERLLERYYNALKFLTAF